jgi:hypothetical protein
MQSTATPTLQAKKYSDNNSSRIQCLASVVTIGIFVVSTITTIHFRLDIFQSASFFLNNSSYAYDTNTTRNSTQSSVENNNEYIYDIKYFAQDSIVHLEYTNYSNNQDINVKPFWPNRALDEYKRWHSNDVLQNESINYILMNRKFSVVYYWCPDRAGNIFHNMYNSITWSIISNRTILIAYESDNPAQNTLDDCDKILQIASWIPRWDEWSLKLNLTTAENKPVPISTTTTIKRNDSFSNPFVVDTTQYRTVIFPQIRDIRPSDTSIYRNEWNEHPTEKKGFRKVRNRNVLLSKEFSYCYYRLLTYSIFSMFLTFNIFSILYLCN